MYSEAIIDIKDILREKFSEENFIHLAINLVNLESEDLLNSTYLNENSTVYENHVDYIKDIGKYRDSDIKTIVLSIVKLKHSPEKSRTMQRNFIAKHMKDIGADVSIVGLYSEDTDIWRISFVKLDYLIDIDGIHEELTSAKRYSYLIEPGLHNHTAVEQLSKLYDDDSKKANIQDIENVFSVEVVTDEFFKMYKEKYLDLKELLEKDVNFVSEAQRLDIKIDDFSEEFAKKLMGQISFLYFLQKKGWLGVKIVPKKISKVELREIYRRQDEETRNIINKVYKPNNEFMVLSSRALKDLSNEDSEKLACSFKNTIYDEEWGTGTKIFIRTIFETSKNNDFNFFNEYLEPLFYNALNKKRGSTEYYQLFNCKIPFLNGGLFEPIYKYDWKNVNVQISNEFFSNEDNEGLLDLFDMYNFTINEDEPLEKEVAVDPEMLGKIFENLLEVKERRSKGAFYTPREIVHYMCQESLINYLSNKIQIPCEDIEMFIKYGEIIKDVDINIDKKENYKMPQNIINNLEEIDKALENVTVADPAVGSGAFPLGMLNEIVKARDIITCYMYKNIKEVKMFDYRSIYSLKKNTMKKSIFAVDIEPSAVDITKLRLWLSLVVDTDIKIVNTLPNLDYNIMVGNSLVDEFRGIKLFDEELLKGKLKTKQVKEDRQIAININENNEINIGIEQEYKLLEYIQSLQNKLFDTKDTQIKKNIKKEIEDKEWELIEYKINREEGLSFKEIEELKKNRSLHKRPYFLWKLEFSKIFKNRGGFDIVIGNPPYIDSEYMIKYIPEVREYCKQKYKSAKGNWDIFIVFIELGLRLVKNEGYISYIVPNKLIGSKYSEAIKKIISKYSVRELRDYSNVNVFKEADVYPIVFRMNKSEIKEDVNISIMENKNIIKSSILIDKHMFYRDIYWDRYFVDNEKKINIIEKVLKFDVLEKIATVKGSATVGEAYDIKEELFNEKIFDYNIESKFINTGTIDRYVSLWDKKETKYIKQSYFKPCINKDRIKNINNTRYEECNKNKIIIGGMNKELECYLDNKGEYLAGKSTTIIYDSKLDLRYIIAILNSKLITFYYKYYFSSLSLAGGYLRIGPPQIKQIPIAFNKEIYDILIHEVDKLIKYYKYDDKENIYIKEEVINNCVYKLYNINEEEIKLIENL